MILRLHGKTLLTRIERRPFRHRPGDEHAAGREPEVVVHRAPPVCLHHEEGTRAPDLAARFARLPKVPLGAVGGEWLCTFGRHAFSVRRAIEKGKSGIDLMRAPLYVVLAVPEGVRRWHIRYGRCRMLPHWWFNEAEHCCCGRIQRGSRVVKDPLSIRTLLFNGKMSRALPHVNFHIDVEKDIERFEFFLSNSSYRAKRPIVLNYYPKLAEQIRAGKHEREAVHEHVHEMYRRYEQQLLNILTEVQEEYAASEMAFAALSKIMEFPELGERTYSAIPTFLPFSPLGEDVFFFSIASSIASHRRLPFREVTIGVHEISHFIFNEQYNRWKKKGHTKLNQPAHHYLKEALTAAIMDQQAFRNFFDYPNLYHSISYPGNPELRNLMISYHGETTSIVEYIKQEVLLASIGYTHGLGYVCEAFGSADTAFSEKWQLWNDKSTSPESRTAFDHAYGHPVKLN